MEPNPYESPRATEPAASPSLLFEPIPSKIQGWVTSPVPISRAKVPGGWIVLIVYGAFASGNGFFLPDPQHQWDGSSLP
jgi:hypothetical protein